MSSCAGTIVLISFSFVDFATHEGSNNNNKKITERQMESSSETWQVLFITCVMFLSERVRKNLNFLCENFHFQQKSLFFLHSMSCENCENFSHHCAIFCLHFSINFPSKVHLLSIVQWTEHLLFLVRTWV